MYYLYSKNIENGKGTGKVQKNKKGFYLLVRSDFSKRRKMRKEDKDRRWGLGTGNLEFRIRFLGIAQGEEQFLAVFNGWRISCSLRGISSTVAKLSFSDPRISTFSGDRLKKKKSKFMYLYSRPSF